MSNKVNHGIISEEYFYLFQHGRKWGVNLSNSDKTKDIKKHLAQIKDKLSIKPRKKRSERSAEAAAAKAASEAGGNSGEVTSKIDKKKVIKITVCSVLTLALLLIIYVAVIIIKAPDIETDNIYSLLSQSSVLYDDDGNIMDTAYGEENRTIVEIDQIPEHVQNAFIALEDKTFETHNGFNIIRIFGAIKDAIFSGGSVSGTSTITQQLARNLYLEDKMYERSLSRKIQEAYYSVILEKELNKDEILEAYLNTIYFGCGFGVQTASQAYFSKDIEDVNLAEAAALAAMPQMPSEYALVKAVSATEVTDDTPNLITKSGDTAYLWNDKCKDRMDTCLYLMKEQGYINEEEYEKAKAVEIKDLVNPNLDALNAMSNYFADYALDTVIKDLQEQTGCSEEKAIDMVYSGGLQIYTTMDSQAQSIIEKEFNNDANFPLAIGYSRDSSGNILDTNGNVLLYAYSNYINSDGKLVLSKDEYKKNDDGSLTIYAGKRLNIYDTEVQGGTDYSLELKSMYTSENNMLYTIEGGYINIPQQYKSRDKDKNLVVSADFFKDYPTFFEEKDGKMYTDQFTLKQQVIQPQAAMTIVDNETGQIKAMIGGRKTSGRKLFNRATTPQQPGSSIKPISVYSAALQKSYDLEKAGKTFDFKDFGYDKQGDQGWGTYLTTASLVDDEPTTIDGRLWPKNSYAGYAGLYTFRTALQQSVNVCAVKILAQVGVDYSADIVEKFGVSTLTRSGSANDLNLAALGMGGMTSGISTLEMASAYTTFVNDGVHKSYSIYTKVTNRNGDLLLEPKTKETKALDPGVAWIMRDVLRTVVTEGIGRPASIPGVQVCGKTGTTDDKMDIWFCGFTPKYSGALWIGTDVNIAMSSYSNMAASLWGRIMGQIDGAKGGSYSSRPNNVVSATVDTQTGLLASENSSHTRREYFTSGTQPTDSSKEYKKVEICTESGYLATPSCPSTKEKSGIMRSWSPSSKVRDKKNELPHYYCNLHNPDPDSYPVEPGKKVTIVEIPKPKPEPSEIEVPDDNDQPEPDDGNPDDGDDNGEDGDNKEDGNKGDGSDNPPAPVTPATGENKTNKKTQN